MTIPSPALAAKPSASIYRHPGFLAFISARLMAVFATQIQAVVVAWQVYDLTRDPLALAYVGLAQLCFRQKARLQPLTRDDYGRTVANVQCAGKDVAAAQVAAGMAWVYTPYAQQHPQLQPLQQRARSQRLGLWSQKRPLAPWTYRQRHRS